MTQQEEASWLGPWVMQVKGLPRPKGSWKCVGKDGKHQLVEQVDSQAWATAVTVAAGRLASQRSPFIGRREPIEGPVGVSIVCTVPLPKSVKAEDRPWPVVGKGAGDDDKLARSVLDSITDGGLWNDDAQVCELLVVKAYPHSPVEQLMHAEHGDRLTEPGATIRIWRM